MPAGGDGRPGGFLYGGGGSQRFMKPPGGVGGEDGIGADTSIQTAIRTGHTTPQERRQMIKKPPHILITTPESLYLLLTSKTGQNMLCTAKAIIIGQ